jgi:putative MATE family efflux protein
MKDSKTTGSATSAKRLAGLDMTHGNLWKKMPLFSVPIMLGYLLQQLYGAVDSAVVGNFIGRSALAAVGMSLPMTVMALGFFWGMSAGAGAITARAFGSGDLIKMRKAIHTTMALATVLGVIISVGGFFVTAPLLRLMHTPDEVFEDALIYFRIYFAGLLATSLYNMGTAILNAFGESRKPLISLVISAVLNIVLDILFVVVFRWGVAGAAFATLLSEVVAAILLLHALTHAKLPCNLKLKSIAFDRKTLTEIVRIGLPVSAERLINGVTNIMLQAYINGLGAVYVAGWGVTGKIDAFVYMLYGAVAQSVITCIGQNIGAGQPERARRGVRIALVIAVSVALAVSVLMLALNVRVLRLFTPDDEVLSAAFTFMKVLTATYWLDSVVVILSDALAGSGHALSATVINTVTHFGVRQAFLFVISRWWYTPTAVALSYPVAWVLSITVLAIVYRRDDWSRFRHSDRLSGV